MGTSESQRRTVLVPQALGADQFLRVTWHAGRRVMVFSHWDSDHCVAATPVRVDDVAELAELVVSAMAQRWNEVTSGDRPVAWPAPHPGDRRADPLAEPA
jgi:hypothetical protein